MRYSYDLFCQRKGFRLQNYFILYPEGTYNDFTTFLNQRNVVPISEENFNSARKKYFESIRPQEPEIEVVLEEDNTEEVRIEDNTKRSKRRRSAKKNSSNIS